MEGLTNPTRRLVLDIAILGGKLVGLYETPNVVRSFLCFVRVFCYHWLLPSILEYLVKGCILCCGALFCICFVLHLDE